MSEIVSQPSPRRRPTARMSARGLIRPIYAGAFDLDPTTGFDSARGVVLDWLRTHRTVSPFLADLPTGDFKLDRHLERDRLLAQMVTSLDGNIVVARLQHQEPDGNSFDPIRNWRTETPRLENNWRRTGVRMTVLPLPGLLEPPMRPLLAQPAGPGAAAGWTDALVGQDPYKLTRQL